MTPFAPPTAYPVVEADAFVAPAGDVGAGVVGADAAASVPTPPFTDFHATASTAKGGTP